MCYDCLDAGIVVGGKRNTCPVCGVLLGPNPFDHSKVKYDSILDSLIKKVRSSQSRGKGGEKFLPMLSVLAPALQRTSQPVMQGMRFLRAGCSDLLGKGQVWPAGWIGVMGRGLGAVAVACRGPTSFGRNTP